MTEPKYKAIIVDDEQPARDIIASYLKLFAQIEVVAQCENGFEALKAVQENTPHIMFLDVQMPKITGIELLEVMENPPAIVFTTAFDEYAIKAFEMNAVDYLLKPFSVERFGKALQKTIERLNAGKTSQQPLPLSAPDDETSLLTRVVVKNGANIKVIALDNIVFIEAQEDFVLIHTHEGRYMKNQTMAYYETHLPPNKFVRIHRSTIVNIERIEKLEAYDKETFLAVVPPNNKLKVSRTGYKRLKELLNI